MTGIADDADSVMEMVGEAATSLQAKDPEHELLAYLKNIGDDKVYAAFVERFGKKNVPEHQRQNSLNTAWMYAQYLVALRAALGELPTPSSILPKPEVRKCQDDQNDGHIPF